MFIDPTVHLGDLIVSAVGAALVFGMRLMIKLARQFLTRLDKYELVMDAHTAVLVRALGWHPPPEMWFQPSRQPPAAAVDSKLPLLILIAGCLLAQGGCAPKKSAPSIYRRSPTTLTANRYTLPLTANDWDRVCAETLSAPQPSCVTAEQFRLFVRTYQLAP